MTEGIIVGVSRFIAPDKFYIEQEDGQFVELIFEKEIRSDELPLDKPVAVVIKNGVVPDIDVFWQEVPIFTAGSRNETRKYVAICGRAGQDMKSAAESIKHFWLTFAHKYWDVRTFGFPMDAQGKECNYFPSVYCTPDMKRVFDALPADEKPVWYPIYWYIFGGADQRYCGQADLGGYRAVSYAGGANNCAGHNTIWHELGHNFGLHHASTDFDNNFIEYGDGTSVMGNGEGRRGLNAVNMYHLGLCDSDEINRITMNSEIVVCPHELPKEARQPNETVYNIIQGTDRKEYMISNRKRRGGRHQLESINNEGILYIHEIRRSRSVLLETLKVGDKTNIIPGVEIEHLEYKNEVCLVRVEFEGNTLPVVKNEIIDQPYPVKLTNTELSEIHDGMWHDPIRNGQGLDLHIKNGRAVLAWYHYPDDKVGYDVNDWLITDFDLGEGIETFPLYRPKGGTFANPSNDLEKVGEGQIYFLDDNTGVFQYRTKITGRGHFPLKPVVKNNAPGNGVYFNDSRDGEGFTLRFLGEDRIIGFWYTYHEKVADPNTKFQRRRWFMFDGERQVDGRYKAKTYKVDGEFNSINLDPPRTQDMGACYFTVIDNNNIDFESTVDQYKIKMSLRRLF